MDSNKKKWKIPSSQLMFEKGDTFPGLLQITRLVTTHAKRHDTTSISNDFVIMNVKDPKLYVQGNVPN